MKTGKRSYPLDMLSVSEDGVSVSIHRHRSQIVVSVDDGVEEWTHTMSFPVFVSFLLTHLHMNGEVSPSMMKGSR